MSRSRKRAAALRNAQARAAARSRDLRRQTEMNSTAVTAHYDSGLPLSPKPSSPPSAAVVAVAPVAPAADRRKPWVRTAHKWLDILSSGGMNLLVQPKAEDQH